MVTPTHPVKITPFNLASPKAPPPILVTVLRVKTSVNNVDLNTIYNTTEGTNK